jgi:hypothetical protein
MFKKAERTQAKIKIALTGPTGAGKTYAALLIAKGMGGKIALIDTENGSASLYADKFDFDTVNLMPPFTYEKYVQAIEFAEKEHYDVIIIDSFSHAWSGEGGTLDQKAILDMNPRSNQFANWKKPKENFTKLKNAMLHSTSHMICTLRSKMSYSQADLDGKKQIIKQGLDPISEPGVEYEFSIVFDLLYNHYAQVSKDRTSLFDGKLFLPTEETGKILMDWFLSAKSKDDFKIGLNEINKITQLAEKASLSLKEVTNYILKEFDKRSHDLNQEEYSKLCNYLMEYKIKEPAEVHTM